MEIREKKIQVKDYLTKSNLPASDYVINPYVGCLHACKYCYARFMKRFTGHSEEWGTFIDIKECSKPVNVTKLKGKTVFISSVTDCYNPIEKNYEVTRKILEQLIEADCHVTICTKSNLVMRDIDLLKQFQDLEVAISINTLDENFKADMDNASSIEDRLNALKFLHDAGIYTVLFMSPIFPLITECEKIIDLTREYVCEYWFENLNLRGEYKLTILDYIGNTYPAFLNEYKKIYNLKDVTYWDELAHKLENFCQDRNVRFVNYFYHEKLVKEKVITNMSSSL